MKYDSATIKQETEQGQNKLLPIFLKLDGLRVLIIGGGLVAAEKISAILNNASPLSITIVADTVCNEVYLLANNNNNIEIIERKYEIGDIEDVDLVFAAVNDPFLAQSIHREARVAGKLVNVADIPDACNFYLGSVVQKGNLKIAISTNGKSPTIAKRIKEVLHDAIPGDVDELLNNMHHIRGKLKGDFTYKVETLNALTRDFGNARVVAQARRRKQQKIVSNITIAILLMAVGHAILSLPFFSNILSRIDSRLYLMTLAGFAAQMVDGAIGMGYGVTCTTILLSMGVNLPAISRSVNTAKIFSIGASGYNHFKLGNLNKKLFKTMVIPGVIGAAVGAFLLVKFGDTYSKYVKPVLAAYTLFLGARIFFTAFKKKKKVKKVKRAGWLAAAGGFLDSFGGGGWGPLVTSTLISKGRTPRFVIGSVNITEAFVAFSSVLTFFILIGINQWQIIASLITGGVIAAPLAARISGRLPVKTMLITVGSFVIFWSLNVLFHLIK